MTTRGGWWLYNVYLIVGMALFFILATFLGERRPEPEHWQEFAHYDPAMVEGGMIRGTVRYQSAADCTNRARQRYHYEFIDILGVTPAPANGIDSPYHLGLPKGQRPRPAATGHQTMTPFVCLIIAGAVTWGLGHLGKYWVLSKR